MQRNTGSFIELFTCRNCKKNVRTKTRNKSAPMTVRPTESNKFAPSTSNMAADDGLQQQHHVTFLVRSSSDANDDVRRVFPTTGRIPRISMSMSSVEISGNSQHNHHSILKNPDDDDEDDDPKRHSFAGVKRARFKEAVDVIVHDNHGNAIVRDRIRLKPSIESSTSPPGERCRKQLFAADDEKIVSRTVARGQDAFSLQSMRIERRNEDGRRFLRLVVGLDEAFTERSIHVCTANGGSRILVVAYRPEPLGDGTNYQRQYVDRFQLPHPIDALSIKGELDEYGVLVITAPLFDFDCDSSIENLILNK